MSDNIFERKDQESKAEYERLGLGDVDTSTAILIRTHALGIISKNNITDEDEKLKVYQDVKRQRLEYQEQREKEREAEYEAKRQEEESNDELREAFDTLARKSDIVQLIEQIQALDERLSKIERYMQE